MDDVMTDAIPAPGMILAGGLSRRMGRNKCLEVLGGKTLLEIAIERLKPQVQHIWINTGPGEHTQWATNLGKTLIRDTTLQHDGPLAGILAGLLHARTHMPDAGHILTVPADTPFFPLSIACRLYEARGEDATIVIAQSSGRRHPVAGLWPLAIADDLSSWLGSGTERRIGAFLERHKVVTVDFTPQYPEEEIDPFFNVNTPDDLEQARNALATMQGQV